MDCIGSYNLRKTPRICQKLKDTVDFFTLQLNLQDTTKV